MGFSLEMARLQGALLLYGKRYDYVGPDGVPFRTEYYFPLEIRHRKTIRAKKSIDDKTKKS